MPWQEPFNINSISTMQMMLNIGFSYKNNVEANLHLPVVLSQTMRPLSRVSTNITQVRARVWMSPHMQLQQTANNMTAERNPQRKANKGSPRSEQLIVTRTTNMLISRFRRAAFKNDRLLVSLSANHINCKNEWTNRYSAMIDEVTLYCAIYIIPQGWVSI